MLRRAAEKRRKAEGYLRLGLPLSAVHASQGSSAKWKVGHKNERGFLGENMSPIRPVGQDLVPLQSNYPGHRLGRTRGHRRGCLRWAAKKIK